MVLDYGEEGEEEVVAVVAAGGENKRIDVD